MTFNVSAYKESLHAFPDVSYQEYQSIQDLDVRSDIAKRNKIVQTDAYNRTMTHIKGEDWRKEEVYGLSLRRSSAKEYVVIDGIRKQIQDIFSRPLGQAELDFAAEYYADQAAKWGNGYFNKAMWQEVLDKHNGYLPLTIRAVKDGTVLRPKEPALTVKWPAELAAVYEPLLLRIFLQSAVATDTHVIDQILGEGRVVEFGKRSAPTEQYHLDAMEGCLVGSSIKVTSNDTAALVYPQLRAGGTIAHRYLASCTTEEEAFEKAILATDNMGLLIDLVDSYKGIDKAIALKKKYANTDKIIGMRLDSGDLADQAIYALRNLEAEGMLDTRAKIVVADVSSVEQLVEIESRVAEAGFDPKKYLVYGLGGLLIAKNKTRDAVSAAFKLIQTEEWATGKLSNDEAKRPISGYPNIEIRDHERVIVQEEEEVQGERLLDTVYDHGELYFEGNDLDAIDQARARVKETFPQVSRPTRKSEKTIKAEQEALTKLLQTAA